MRQRKYTLPRHTNLANQGPRIGAFFIDLAIAFAITLGFLFACFRFVFNFKTEPLSVRIEEERVKSGLFYKVDDKLDYYGRESDNVAFRDALVYFYTVYIPVVDENKDVPVTLEDGTEVSKLEHFTIEWFNKEVLKIEDSGNTYFEYQKDGEIPVKNVIGVIKSDAGSNDVNSFLQTAWIQANYDLNHLETFRGLNNEFSFYNTLEFVLSALIGTAITYIVLPIILKNGTTLGKKVFGLCLADSDGHFMKNYQLLMRIMPLDVTLLAMLIPIWSSLLNVMIVLIVLLLVSFTIMMASPKRTALHDFTARTIVINAKTSILFENSAQEEAYIAKEDGIELDEPQEGDGEEPTLRYER